MPESKTDYYRLLSDAFGSVVPGTREARKVVYNQMRAALKEQAKLAPHRLNLGAEQRALEKAILDIEISAKLGEPIPRWMPGSEPKPESVPAPRTQAMPRVEWVDPAAAMQPDYAPPSPPQPQAASPQPSAPVARPAANAFQPAFLNRTDRVSYASKGVPRPQQAPPRREQQPPPQQQGPARRPPLPQPAQKPDADALQRAAPPSPASPPASAAVPAQDDVNVLGAPQPGGVKKNPGKTAARKTFAPHDEGTQEKHGGGKAGVLIAVIAAAVIGGAIAYFAKPEQWIEKLLALVDPPSATAPAPKAPPTGAGVSLGEQREPNADELVELAISLTRERQYGRALETLEQAEKKGAASAQFFQARAYAHWGARDIDRAIDDYSTVIRIDPGNGQNYTNRAVAYNSRGEYSLAVRDLERAIAIEPNNPDNWNSRCWARALAGQLQEAILDCNESLRLRPNDPNTLDSRGFAHLKAGQNSRAIADFDAVLKTDPKAAGSLYGRGLARLRSGNRTEGNADIAAAREIHPEIEAMFSKYGVR